MKMQFEIEPGSSKDRCSRCGGWISLGHVLGSGCRPMFETEEEAAEAADNGRNTGGKSYYRGAHDRT